MRVIISRPAKDGAPVSFYFRSYCQWFDKQMHTWDQGLVKENSATCMQELEDPANKCILGIDLGATFLRIARVNAAGGELFFVPTPPTMEAEDVLTSVTRLACRGQEVHYAGLSRAPGVDVGGHVTEWPSRPDWAGLPLVPWIRRAANAPVISADDGVCAALWEHRLRGIPIEDSSTACISIGTGLAVGIMQGNQAVPTGDGAATLSHQRFGPFDFPCRCGQRGCLQTVLSVRGLEKILAAAKIAELQGAFHEFVQVLKSLYHVNTVIITGGGVSLFGARLLLQILANRTHRDVAFVVSNTPSLSGIGGSLLLAVEGEREQYEFWTQRTRNFMRQEGSKWGLLFSRFAKAAIA